MIRRATSHVNHGQVDITCDPADLVDVVATLRETDGLRCEFFTFLSAIDRSEFGGADGEKVGGLEVLIHLYSPEHVDPRQHPRAGRCREPDVSVDHRRLPGRAVARA